MRLFLLRLRVSYHLGRLSDATRLLANAERELGWRKSVKQERQVYLDMARADLRRAMEEGE